MDSDKKAGRRVATKWADLKEPFGQHIGSLDPSCTGPMADQLDALLNGALALPGVAEDDLLGFLEGLRDACRARARQVNSAN